MNISVAFNGICHLGECPIWNAQHQKLYWTDIYNRRIWVYDPASNESCIFWEGAHQVGGFAFTRSGGMILCTDKGVFIIDPDYAGNINAEPRQLLDIPLSENERFNDITVDPEGRIFAGTLVGSGKGKGILYRFEMGKEPVVVLTDLQCSNGMTFSMDKKYFYHTDSGPRIITRYQYDQITGEISNPEILYRGKPEDGSPDGITIDSEDCIWAAFWGASCIRRFNVEGKVISKIMLPAKQPSSVMFGGANMDELYITSACQGADNICTGYNNDGTFLGGQLYMYCPGVAGRLEWLADF